MYLKLPMPINILFFCNFVHSFTDPLQLQNQYKEIINENKVMEIDVHTCNYAMKDKLWWAATCRNIIQIIRNDIGYKAQDTIVHVNEYRNCLFMNYRPIAQSHAVCEKKKIIFPEEDGTDRNDPIEQNLLNCYASAAIETVPYLFYPHFKEISICPTWTGDMIVFKCKNNECEILDRIENRNWHESYLITEKILNIEIPRSFTGNDMMATLRTNSTIIEKQLYLRDNNIIGDIVEAELFEELCNIVYGSRPEFESKLRKTKVNYSTGKLLLRRTINLILDERVTEHQDKRSTTTGSIIATKGYSCRNIFATGKRGSCTTYKIIAGPENNSIILAEPLQIPNRKHLYIPLELIYNLHLEYIINFQKYF